MEARAKKRVLYGEANYKNLVKKNGYYVDKTAYIRVLENYDRPFFLRPRRFGKSLWCSTLQYYYDINERDNFEELFGHTSVGKEPTPSHNSFMVLPLDLSVINVSGKMEEIRSSFNKHCNERVRRVLIKYEKYLGNSIEIDMNDDISNNLQYVLGKIDVYELPKLYVIIDEYDNFANQLVMDYEDNLYADITGKGSFMKTFYKVLKSGAQERTIGKTFITGVLPTAIDDMASGYNVAEFVTLKKKFEAMIGFTAQEMELLLESIFEDYHIDPIMRTRAIEIIANNYDGYHFVDPNGEALYNPTNLIFFLRNLVEDMEIPEYLIDENLRTDLSWVRHLNASNPDTTAEMVDQLTIHNRIYYENMSVTENFNLSRFFEKNFYPLPFFYLGMLTREDEQHMCLPNMNMRCIFNNYFNEIHKIDVSNKYSHMMISFINNPHIPKLFADYWELYISQLPEVIFMQMNENFYRTTFFELCRRHLSSYFTWAVEKSYARGRTDLEFIGRYQSKFSNVRFLLEFKYWSNSKLEQIRTHLPGNKIEMFEAQNDDLSQIRAYQEEWRKEHPEADTKSFLIYCFGNQGFRVFPIES